jgi:ribosome biogenesis GTPase
LAKHSPKTTAKAKHTATVLEEGLVVATYGHSWRVALKDELVTCSLRRDAEKAMTKPVTGDNVVVARMSGQFTVVETRPRRTVLTRADPHLSTERAIAANADLAVIVVSVVAPPLRPRLIDRCLVAAYRGRLEPAVCVNKVDLLDDHALETELAVLQPYRKLGIPVLACSTHTGFGLDALLRLLRGKTSVLLGHSGVGKSSLLNALNPSVQQRVGAVRGADGKGRHTTTVSTLLQLGPNTRVIDTPGFREFGLGDVTACELQQYYPEFAPYAGQCAFGNCTHIGEPGCQVKAGVRQGAIPRLRYESYRKLLCGADTGEATQQRHTHADSCSDSSFECAHCGAHVVPEGAGTRHRNHCPHCLWSVHLDRRPGDRASYCEGQMEPIAIWIRHGGEWAVIHRCSECGTLASNRIAADDNELLLLSLAVKPLAMPPFPLSRAGLALPGVHQ